MAPIPCSAPDCTHTFDATLPGDVLLTLIQLHARTAHPATPVTHDTPTAKGEKVKRPSIAAAGTGEDWNYFIQRWHGYKVATRLTGQDIIFQLLECTEESLRKDLTRTHGNLIDKPEETVLELIRSLTVRPVNIMVARVNLNQLKQDRDEPMRSFCARLRGQASVCKFLINCPCEPSVEVDFSDQMVRDALINGLEDEEIRLDILAQSKQNMTLDEVLQLAEAKESGKRSAQRLHIHNDNTAVSAAST